MEIHHDPLEGGDFQATQVSEQEQLVHATEQDQLIAESHAQPHTASDNRPKQTPEQPTHLSDDHLIHYHITEALREDRPIDHATARCIAAQLHNGQASALYALASNGAVVDGLRGELDSWRRDETPVEVEPWLDALDEYLTNREDDSPIDGWQQLWPAQPERDDDEPDGGEEERPPYGNPVSAIGRAVVRDQVNDQGKSKHSAEQHDEGEQPVEPPVLQPSHDEITATGQREVIGPVADLAEQSEAPARQDLMQRIAVAGITVLGEVGTIIESGDATGSITEHNADGNHHDQNTETEDKHEEDEPDTFSWADAARWSPGGGVEELARNRVDLLFGEIPDEELGSVEEMGWFGLLRHEDRPGGIILSQNSYGFRHMWETDSDEQLAEHWEQLQREYEAFTEATGVHGRESGGWSEDDERTETGSVHHPEIIWVGSLSDYNNGRLHGVWLDATLDPDELRDAIAFMLRNGYDSTAEEWGIFDYDDFCGLNLGEYESLEVVSRIAKGIAEHGEAFAHWVGYVGERSEEQLSDECFLDHYLGNFESTEAYVENMLEECDAYSFEEFVPDWLKPYVKIDVELLARDSEIELYITEGQRGGVFVFDTRY